MLSLKQYNIVDVYAGFSHSLFQTLEGKIIACGDNSYGELPINSQPYFRPNLPMETVISNGVTFCVAGSCVSLFFFGHDILRNPNRRVNDFSIDTSLLIKEYNSNLKTDIFLHIEKPKLERVNTHTKLREYDVKDIMKLTVVYHKILKNDHHFLKSLIISKNMNLNWMILLELVLYVQNKKVIISDIY